jgi:hypothetical protein
VGDKNLLLGLPDPTSRRRPAGAAAKAPNRREPSSGGPGASSQTPVQTRNPVAAGRGGERGGQTWTEHGTGARLDARLLSEPEGAPRKVPSLPPEWHCSPMLRRPVAEKTATGTPPGGRARARARAPCLPSAQAGRWVRIFPVCRGRHRQVNDLGPLDEGVDRSEVGRTEVMAGNASRVPDQSG